MININCVSRCKLEIYIWNGTKKMMIAKFNENNNVKIEYVINLKRRQLRYEVLFFLNKNLGILVQIYNLKSYSTL